MVKIKKRRYTFLLLLLVGCSPLQLPVDKELRDAILMDLNGRDYYQDPTYNIQDSLIFIGIEFNYKGYKDSLLIFHQSAPPFLFLPEVANNFIGFWRKKGYCIVVANSVPSEVESLSHLKIVEFDTDYEHYNDLLWEFEETLNVCYDGKLYRTFGKYHNGKLTIGQTGWFDNY